MKQVDSTTPVVILGAGIGALAIMRTLGPWGVRIVCVDPDRKALVLRSRYCSERIIPAASETIDPEGYLAELTSLGARLGRKAVLFWTSDELALLCAEHADRLDEFFLFPHNDFALVHRLQDKREMRALADAHGVPTPGAAFPQSVEDVERFAATARYPIMLKGIIGNRLLALTGEKMRLVHTPEELVHHYSRMEDPESPNLMLQEGIPGDDDQVYIFNGYFDEDSECLNPFTGHKIRQHPIHKGCASLGINRWNQDVAELTMDFMKAIGYRGVLDIGYRLDPRDHAYKVLDINPRIGQAFRIFVGEDGTDVARDMYLDLTDQPRVRTTSREGRKWVIEDWDLSSSRDYWGEGTLTFGKWVRSWKGVEEGAWWCWRDPLPFVLRMGGFVARVVLGRLRRATNAPAADQPARLAEIGAPETG